MAAGKKVSMTWSFLKASLPGEAQIIWLFVNSLYSIFYILFILYSFLIFLFEV